MSTPHYESAISCVARPSDRSSKGSRPEED
jgi:hypothetical protein